MMSLELTNKIVKFVYLGAGVQALDQVNMVIFWKCTMYQSSLLSYKLKKTKSMVMMSMNPSIKIVVVGSDSLEGTIWPYKVNFWLLENDLLYHFSSGI